MKKIKILVVEDEKPLLKAIETKLEKMGLSVKVARSAEDGLKCLKKIKIIHAIWLDHYLLGKKTGIDLVTECKNDPKLKNIPIFVVSNTASSDKVHEYLDFKGVKYYIKAENKLEDIINNIKDYLNNKNNLK